MKLRHIFPLSLLLILIISSCKKDDFLSDSSGNLKFSTDTVSFDTVFHYAGSTTKRFLVYNKENQTINISKIYLATGTKSSYKINVDGISTTTTNPIISDIEILPHDSLFVFVQVFVNPNSSAPLLIHDEIIFETNGEEQNIKLVAIGQDVYLHKPIPGEFYSIIGRSGFDTILPNDKPHLVFGYIAVDSACKVTVQGGTKFYMYNNAGVWVYRDGSLVIAGTKGNEVVFQGARLESEFKDSPGQWGQILLSPLSKNNKIDWAIIKNGSIGIQVDTLASTTIPTLNLSNTIIKNMSSNALLARGSSIRAKNCVFANCGGHVVSLIYGGNYRFDHCTFANYWSNSSRTASAIALNNYYVTDNLFVVRDLDNAYFGNCIIYGNIAEEVAIDSSMYGTFNYKFNHCIVKTSMDISNGSFYSSAYTNDPGFKDPGNSDFHLSSSSSFAVNKGDPAINVPFDLNNAPRTDGAPDLGAYEF